MGRSAIRIDRNARFESHHERVKPVSRPKMNKEQAKATMEKIGKAVLTFRFNTAFLIVGLMATGVLLGIAFLANYNRVATKGYDLKRLEANRQQLLSVYEVNNMKVVDVQSLPYILKSNRVSSMVKATKISYVVPNSAVAMVNLN